MQQLSVATILLLAAPPLFGQIFEPHSTDCIETAPLGLWSPRVTFDEDEYRGQWFVADGPLGGSCSSGGGFFQAGNVMKSGQPVDVRELGVGSRFITAILKSKTTTERPIRRVWNVQITEPGDVDGDGVVGFQDFITISRQFGNEADRRGGDLDYSGDVGFGDFVILSRNFGSVTSDSNTVVNTPEPSSFFLGVVLLPFLKLFRRRQR